MHENTFLIGGKALKRRRERQRKRGGRAKRRGNTKIYNLAWLWSTGRGYDHLRRVVLNNAFVTLRRVEWQPRIRNVPNKRVQKSLSIVAPLRLHRMRGKIVNRRAPLHECHFLSKFSPPQHTAKAAAQQRHEVALTQ